MSAYEKALRADKSAGGAHSSFLRGKLKTVAPRAASAFMKKKRYESAKVAADKASSYGAGNTAAVKRVRSGLEKQAAVFYKSALKKKNKQKSAAKKLCQRILKMVPKKSPSYSKALKLLSKL
jgi:hypothetical protein